MRSDGMAAYTEAFEREFDRVRRGEDGNNSREITRFFSINTRIQEITCTYNLFEIWDCSLLILSISLLISSRFDAIHPQ